MSILLGATVSAIAFLTSAQALAQTAGGAADTPAVNPDNYSEIVVTAQKRSQRLQDVPVSVQALTPSTIERAGAETTTALQTLVPGLNVNDSASGFRPFIRGVGTSTAAAGNENSVSTYIDNIYLTSMNAGFLDLSSIESIEVLKGPQGTLFGRNATGGVIHIKTKTPSHQFNGKVTLKYDNYETIVGSGYVTGGLSDTIAADLAVYYRHQGQGYGKNLATGHEINKDESFTVRSKILFTPSDDDTFTLAVDYSKLTSTGQNYRPLPGTTVGWGGNDSSKLFGGPYNFPKEGGYWDIDHAVDPFYRQWAAGVSLTYEHVFSWSTFSSFTAFRKSKIEQGWNSTPIPVNAAFIGWWQPEQQFSQEFQLASNAGSPVHWIIGAYYLNAQVRYDPLFVTGLNQGGGATQQQFNMKQKIQSPALYGQFTAPIEALGDTNVTGGLRYTIDKRSIVGDIEIVPQVTPVGPNFNPHVLATVNPTNASKTFRTFTWRLGIDHHFSHNSMIYLSYNRGFKAGAYNSIPPGGPNAKPTNPEYLDAYEIGTKNTLFDSRATLNVAAFLYRYRDLQVTIINGPAATTVNAAKAQIKGIDIGLNVKLSDNFRFELNGELLDHKFVKYPNGPIVTPVPFNQGGGVTRTVGDLRGKPLPYTAKATLSSALYFDTPTTVGDFDANVNFSYNSGYTFEPSATIPAKSFIDLGGTVGLTLKNNTTRIALFGKNLTNEHAPKVVATGGNPGGFIEIQYRPPRTYGLMLSQKF
ncbi:MAG: TonB-dependent receptor [Sphingobium sp.]